jgi:hypothetical protein
MAADGTVDEASQFGLRAEPGIGGHFVRHPARIGCRDIEQHQQGVADGAASPSGGGRRERV